MANKVTMILFVPLISLLLLFSACTSTKPGPFVLEKGDVGQWEKRVVQVVAEPERAAKLKRLGRELIVVSEAIRHDIDELGAKIATLNKKFDANGDEFREILNEFRQKRNPKYEQYRDLLFAMRGEVDAQEWKELLQ